MAPQSGILVSPLEFKIKKIRVQESARRPALFFGRKSSFFDLKGPPALEIHAQDRKSQGEKFQ